MHHLVLIALEKFLGHTSPGLVLRWQRLKLALLLSLVFLCVILPILILIGNVLVETWQRTDQAEQQVQVLSASWPAQTSVNAGAANASPGSDTAQR
jgi:hypothetical protein